jgi:hypothetical protein
MKAETLYMWFRIYQAEIKDDTAKFDFLGHIRKETTLDPQHELFYFNYDKKHKIPL